MLPVVFSSYGARMYGSIFSTKVWPRLAVKGIYVSECKLNIERHIQL